MLPGALGFALVAGAGGTVTGGLGRAAALRHQAAFEARYGREAQRTMLGTAMFERLQQALKDSRLKQDAPEVTQQILRSQLKGTGFETVYIDTEMAAAKEHGMEDLRAVAKAAGLTDEELQQAVDQKGTITIAGEQFAQAASSPELLDAASFSPEAESMARMREGAKATLDAIRERSERTLREQEALQKGILDNYFPEDNTQETAEKRDALAAAMMQNPENPAEGWKQVRGEYRAQLDEILAPALAALKDGMGKGGLTMEVKDADGFTHTIRYSENSPWYKNFWAMHKRAPTAAELEDMAIALTTGDASAPKVEGWIVPDAETQAAMEQTRPIIEALQKNLAALDRVKGTVRSLNGVEMELTKGMSGEAFQVYKDLTRGLEQAPAKAAQAARMGAAIFARHADIWAKKVTEKTGAKATAMDYYRKHFGLDLEGKYVQGGAYAQPVTNTRLNLDQQVDVLDFDAMESPLEGKTPKEIIQYINENLSDTVETTADFRADVGMPKSSLGKEHIVHVRTKNQQDSISARNFTLSNFRDVIRHAYVIEETANTKKGPITEDMSKNAKKTQRRKNRVQSYFRLMVPVKAGGKLRTLVLTAENFGEKVTLDKTKTELYEAEYDKQERPLPALPRSDAYRIHAGSTTVPLTTSLRDMLRGVKDYAGNPYVEEDGTAHYGLYLENGVMYLDEAQVERYRQMAGEGFSPAFVSWFGDSKIVNADGSPRVAYHGTATDGIRMFDTKKAQDKAGRQMGMGWGKGKFYFSFSEGAANAAASGAQYRGQGKHPQVMPVYLRVENPITAQAYAERYREISGGHELSPARYDDSYTIKDRDKFIAKLDKQLKKEGIDGILDEETGSVAVFDSRQVKSVENQGTFDASNPDIFYQQAWHGSPHVFDAFDLGAIGTGEGNQAHGWGLYFAKDRKVAEYYRELLSDGESGSLHSADIPENNVLLDEEKSGDEQPKKVREALRAIVRDIGKNLERLHEVDRVLADDSMSLEERHAFAAKDRNRLMDSEKELLLRMAAQRTEGDASWIYQDITMFIPLEDGKNGHEIYSILSQLFGNDERASRILNEYGVKGIKYGGMSDGECFVVFDDKAVSIIEQYNQAANDASVGEVAEARLRADAKAWKERLKEAWQGKSTEGKTIPVMRTPLALQLVGAPDLPLVIGQGKLMKIKADHPEMTKAVLNRLPEALADPMLIFRSETVPGRIVACLDLKDTAGVNVVAPVALDVRDGRVEVNVLASVYGRGTNGHTETQYAWFADNVQDNTLYINKEKAADFFQSAGLQLPMEGRKFNDFFGDSIKTQDDLVKAKSERPGMYQNGGRVNKGLITPLSDGRRIITLLEDADESTFVHEMGHLFLMDLADLAQVDEVSAKELKLVDDWAAWQKGAAKEYEGTDFAGEFAEYEQQIIDAEANGDFNTADRVKRRWRQERFARAFELYLREGKAPAKGLKRVFQQFKDWLRFVYTAFTGDGGRASEPVRRVMDRMIATEEEIEEMRLDDRYRDVEAAGGEKLLTESERETYERWKKDAEEEAKTQLRKIVMQDLSARRQQEFDARVDRERERYQKELEQNPVVLAKRALD